MMTLVAETSMILHPLTSYISEKTYKLISNIAQAYENFTMPKLYKNDYEDLIITLRAEFPHESDDYIRYMAKDVYRP